jgi:hypothetical protein
MPETKFTTVSFYIVAHADDWQLFMQPNAYNHLTTPDNKVVIIVTTAGDAGAAETFWSAREEGMKSSLRFCIAPHQPIIESKGTRQINIHTLNYCSINNATCYFLRLPDGNLDGHGFSTYGYQSLYKLKTGELSTITAIDNSAIYNWPGFFNTLQDIIKLESEGIMSIVINYLNPDKEANPNDHIDHIITGQAIQDIPIIKTLHQVLFVGYSVSNNEPTLDYSDLFWKSGMFAAYEKAVYDESNYSTLQESISTYTKWINSSARFISINP